MDAYFGTTRMGGMRVSRSGMGDSVEAPAQIVDTNMHETIRALSRADGFRHRDIAGRARRPRAGLPCETGGAGDVAGAGCEHALGFSSARSVTSLQQLSEQHAPEG